MAWPLPLTTVSAGRTKKKKKNWDRRELEPVEVVVQVGRDPSLPTLHHVVHDGVAELSVAAELAELLHPVGGQHQVGHSLQARPAAGDHQVQAAVQMEGLLLSSLHGPVPLLPRRLR